MTTTTNHGVPLPPDATYVHDRPFEGGERTFWGTDRDGVWTVGFQKADGSVRGRGIRLDFNPGDMSAAEARDLGVRLIAAADELDRIEVPR